ncbi:hypothetical protein Skr01_61630 [Sphaerisporangium krabiense]|uniref:Uncharacterized protein n=1 Tax=Sphaerisporangium krabiense TaxID=763782 RepID=A0A7W9DPB7_9ACTN|nr:hypothetical protein [Sphaerisporangium krabiense]GII66078.1 hypothetical protein Skr01_61630 [Sphaerisporangium krabiense]
MCRGEWIKAVRALPGMSCAFLISISGNVRYVREECLPIPVMNLRKRAFHGPNYGTAASAGGSAGRRGPHGTVRDTLARGDRPGLTRSRRVHRIL